MNSNPTYNATNTSVIYKGKSGFKVKPIQVKVKRESFNALANILRRNNKSNEYIINQLISSDTARIQPLDEKISKNITDLLTQNGYQFHTILGNEDKKKHTF